VDPTTVGLAFLVALAIVCLIPAVLATYLMVKTPEGEVSG